MSSFTCVYCGKDIIDTEKGYITGCVHYPEGENVEKETVNQIFDGMFGEIFKDKKGE